MQSVCTQNLRKPNTGQGGLTWLEEEEFENYALPLNVAIVTIADFIASEEDMTEDDRKTAAIVLYMIAQKLENSGDSEIEPRLQH